jgi:hypothetical protein
MSESDPRIERFLKSLNEEKLQAQERRNEFAKLKISFIIGLFALGSVELKNIDLALVLYIIPFISIGFDLYILGEDYGVKRMGSFVRNFLQTELESKWEFWVGKRRDPFATVAVPILSLLVVVACAAVLFQKGANRVICGIWFMVNLIAVVFLYVYSRKLRLKLLEDETEGRMIGTNEETKTLKASN